MKDLRQILGFRRVRRWIWRPFVNEGRTDVNLKLSHWEREDHNQNEPYIFSKFNKNKMETVRFTDEDFDRVLKPIAGPWTLAATRHLLELCELYDLRWFVIDCRFSREEFGDLSMEDLKDWYYRLTNIIKADQGINEPAFIFDADHEKRRKEQLELLWNRTTDEIKEEENLKNQMKKLEAKRKEREKRAQDLQRLINSSERSSAEPEANGATGSGQLKSDKRRSQKNRNQQLASQLFAADNSTNLRFPEFRSAGPHLRSHEMKLPSNAGQKKLKIIDAAVEKYGLQIAPPAFEEVVRAYNDFRTKVVHAQELKTALQAALSETQ
ncbi:hypothetical protein M3Y97_00436300 [Aphelenchoides bicaudatus]|nr:hypothetical protein M3Y97_00436300 [Aphelenchoides bicaudatus]